MKITKIESVRPYLKHSRYVGIGKTAICYRTIDNRLLKIYLKTSKTLELYDKRKELLNHLELLSTISNESIIGPEEALVKNNRVVGYIYPYIDGTTVRRLPNNTKLSSLFASIPALVEDTNKMSETHFKFNDLHDGNIIYDGNKYYIIDLDKGCINTDAHGKIIESRLTNLTELRDVLLNSFFKADGFHIVHFRDPELEYIFSNIGIYNQDKLITLYDALCEKCESDDPSLGLVRSKTKRYTTPNDYKIKKYLYF